MKNRIYNLIKDNPNTYNSVELGRMLNITPDDVRAYIREITLDTTNYEYGIISIGNSYKLADTLEDVSKKKAYYTKQHKQLNRMVDVWTGREFKINGDKFEIENEEFIEASFLEPGISIILSKLSKDILEGMIFVKEDKTNPNNYDTVEEFIDYATMNKQDFYGLIDDGKYPTHTELYEYYYQNKEKENE